MACATVLLPGTGSDDDYVYRAFSAALHDAGAAVVAPQPEPDAADRGLSRRELDNAAAEAPIAVGGVSIGAAVATAWALAHPAHARRGAGGAAGVDRAPGNAPPPLPPGSRRSVLRRDGLAAATAQMRAASPPWLADELTRSWVGQWPALPDAMEEAAGYVGADRARSWRG